MQRGKHTTERTTRSELRRERAQEYEATMIFPVLGRNVRFLSMVATPLKLADLL
jgi:hypothetical protein